MIKEGFSILFIILPPGHFLIVVLLVPRLLLLYTVRIDGFLHLGSPTHSKPLVLLVH